MDRMELTRLSAATLAQSIARGDLSALEVTEAAIARIEEVNPRINAVVVKRYDQARAEARNVDARRARGEPLPALAGVPVTIKECIDLAGTPSTFGLPWRAGIKAERYKLQYQTLLARPLLFATMVLIAASVSLRIFRLGGVGKMILSGVLAGFLAGLVPADIIKNFGKGFGDVMGSVGIIIGLGTMLGGVLVLSGGADRLATGLTSIGGKNWVPWTTFFVALLIGLPLFFEVGFVLLVPIALVIAKRAELPILRVGLPMLAGLSIAHGLVPPHPAPTLAVEIFHADPGKTILLAIIVGLPTGLCAGPIFATLAQAWLHPAGSPVNIQAAVATRSEPTVGSGK